MNDISILVAGHDWGGLNLLAPLLRAWGADARMSTEFLGAPTVRRDLSYLVPGLAFATRAEELSDWIFHREADLDVYLEGLLKEGRYDLVVCSSSAHALLERRLLHVARRSGVPSVAFCDMWCAYAERFYDGHNWTLPDRLWVIDEAMRASAANIEWPAPLPIDVVGSPLFADLLRRREQVQKTHRRSIRFISEPASTKFPEAGIDEFAVAEALVSVVRATGEPSRIIIRPHPTESAEAWRRWCFARRDLGVSVDTLPLEHAIDDTAMAVGISSILLAEMRICGVLTASFQPTTADPQYFCLPFEDFGIARVCDRAALAVWLSAPGDPGAPSAAALHAGAIDRATQNVFDLINSRRHLLT
jgi:hypothetical protein